LVLPANIILGMLTRREFIRLAAASAALQFLPMKLFGNGKMPDEIKGIAYEPFRPGQSPGGIYPTEEEIRDDFRILSSFGTPLIRQYGLENNLSLIPQICEEYSMPNFPAARMTDSANDRQQLDSLISIAGRQYAGTRALIVGSDSLKDGMRIDDLISAISYVRQNTADLPVTTAESWSVWLQYPALRDACDFCMMHVDPYKDGISIDDSVEYVFNRWWDIVDRYGYPIMIGAAGWPTEGAEIRAAVPSEENQAIFLSGLIRDAGGAEYFFHEAFDQDWRNDGCDRRYGLFRSDGTPKLAVTGYVPAGTRRFNQPAEGDAGTGGGGGSCFIETAFNSK
jgi:exo-beta-1,3-glucanase (GH17 family)